MFVTLPQINDPTVHPSVAHYTTLTRTYKERAELSHAMSWTFLRCCNKVKTEEYEFRKWWAFTPLQGVNNILLKVENNETYQESISLLFSSLFISVTTTTRHFLHNTYFITYFVGNGLNNLAGACTSNDALMLLRCCGSYLPDEMPARRAELSEKVWCFYEDSGVQLDASHYNALLKNRSDPYLRKGHFCHQNHMKGTANNNNPVMASASTGD